MPLISRPIVDPAEYEEFGCHPFEDSPATPDKVSRNVFIRRQVAARAMQPAHPARLRELVALPPHDRTGDEVGARGGERRRLRGREVLGDHDRGRGLHLGGGLGRAGLADGDPPGGDELAGQRAPRG